MAVGIILITRINTNEMLFFPKFGMLGESLGDFANELLRDAIVHWSFFISQDVALNVILFCGGRGGMACTF